MATQVGELPDVVTYPIAHELDPPPWHTAYPTNVKTYPMQFGVGGVESKVNVKKGESVRYICINL